MTIGDGSQRNVDEDEQQQSSLNGVLQVLSKEANDAV